MNERNSTMREWMSTRMNDNNRLTRTKSKYPLTTTCILVGLMTLLSLSGCHLAERRAQKERAEAERNSQVEAYLIEAETLRSAGDDEAALDVLAKAVEINPTIFQAQIGMADIYRTQGDNNRAIDKYRKAIAINPKDYDANYFLGLCLQLTDRFAEAIRAYRRAIAIDPESPEANLNVATAYLQTDQPLEALPFGKRAAELQPDHGPTHINLAAIYSALGMHENAVREYQNASELMELPPDVMVNFADGLRVLKRYPEMINTLQALIRRQPTPAAYERLGYAYFKTKQFTESKDAYRKSVAMDDSYYPALNGLAVNLLNDYIRSGHTQAESLTEAVELLRKSIRIEANQPRIVDLLSRYGR